MDRFTLELDLAGSPERAWRALTDVAEVEAFTGADAFVDARPRAAWMAWNGYAIGRVETSEPPVRLALSWRTTDFPAAFPDAALEFRLRAEGQGTRLTVRVEGVPDNQGGEYRQVWLERFLEPLARRITRGADG